MSVIQRSCAAVCRTLSIALWLGLFAYAMRWSTLLCAEQARADIAAYADNWTTVVDLAAGGVADEGTVHRHKNKFLSSEDSNVTKDAKRIRSNGKHCRREGTVPCVGAAYKALFQVISSVEASNVLSDSFMLSHVGGIQGQLPAPFDGVHVNNVAPVLTSPCRVVEGVQLVDIAGCSQVVSPQSNYRANGINASDVSVASGMCLVAQLPAVEPSSTSDRVMKDQPLCASAVDTVITRTRCGIANWTKTLCGSACSHRVDSTEPKATEHLVFAMQRTSLYSGTERISGVVEDDHSDNFKVSLGFQQEVAGPNTNPVVELLSKPEDSNKAKKDANHRNPGKQSQQAGTMPCVGVTSMSLFQVTSGEALSTVQSINGCDLSVGSVGLPDEEFLLGYKQVVVTELNANMVRVFECNHGGTSSTNGISFTRLVQVMLEEELGTALNDTLTFSHIIPDIMGVPWTKVDGIHSIVEDDELPVGTTIHTIVFSNRLISDVLSFVSICEVASGFNNHTRTITCTDPSTADVTFMTRVQPTLVVASGTVLDGMSTFIHINQGILGELLRSGGGQHFVGICGTFVLANNLSDSDWPLNGNQPVIIITNVVCCVNSHTNSCPGPVSLMNGHDVCLTSYDAQPATDPAPDVSIITNSVICAGLVPAMDQSGLSTCTSIFLLIVGKPDHQLSTEIDPNRTTALRHLWMGSADHDGLADCCYTRPFIPSWPSTFEMSMCAWKSWQGSPCHGVKLVTDTDGVSFASTNAHNDPGCPINNVNLSNMPCTGHVANHSTMVISGLAVSVGVITLQNGIRLSNERSQSTQGGPGVKVDGVHPFIEINGVTVGITSCADLLTNWLVTDVQPRIGIYGVTSGFNDRTMVAVTCTDPTSAGVAFMMCVQPTLVEASGTVLDGMSTFIHINQGILGELLRAGGGQPFVGICGTIAVVNDLSDSDWPFDGNQPATRVTPVACGVDSCAHSYTDPDSLIDGHGVCLTDYDVQSVADFASNADTITNCTIDSAGLIPAIGHRAYNTCTGSHTSVYRLFVVKLDCNLTTKCDDDHPNPTTAQHKHPWTGIEGAGVLVAHFYTRLVSPNWPYYWKWISLYGGKIVTDADGVTSASSNACNDDVEPMDTSRNSQVAHTCNGSTNFINGCDVSAGVVTLVDLQLRSVKASDGHYIDQLDPCRGTVLSCSTAVPTVDCHSIWNQSVMWRDGTNWLRVESSSGNSCTVAVVAAPRTVTEAFDDRVNGTSGHTIPNFATPASPGKGHDVAADDGTTLLLEGEHALANPPSPQAPTRLLAMGWLLGSRADCARRRSIALSAMPCQSVTASSSVVNGDIAMWLTTMVALVFATIVLISPPLMVQLMACTVALMVGIGGYIMEPVLMGLGATSVAVGFVMSTNLITIVVVLGLCVLMSLLLHDIHFELWTCAILSVAYWTCTTWIGWTMSLPVGGGLVCIAWWMRRSWLLFPDDSDASTQQTIFDWKPMAVQGYVCELLGLDLEKAKDNELNAKFERATGRALASASEQELNQDFGVDGVTAKSIYVGVSSILEKLKDSNDKRTAIGARSTPATQQQPPQQDASVPRAAPTRHRPSSMYKGASSIDAGKKKKIFGACELGNVHNISEFVRCTALVSANLSSRDRHTLSDGFRKFNVAPEVAWNMAQECADELLRRHDSMLSQSSDRRDLWGLYRFRDGISQSGNRDEQRMSLPITDTFVRYLALVSSVDGSGKVARRISFNREQFDESKNPQDGAVNINLEGGSVVAATFEFAKNPPADGFNFRKEPQLFQYVHNNYVALPPDKSPVALGIAMPNVCENTPDFQLFGYYQDATSQFHIVPITNHMKHSSASLAGLFYAVVNFALSLEMDSFPSLDAELPYVAGTGGNVLCDGHQVKVFNYTDFFKGRLGEDTCREVVPLQERCHWGVSVTMLGATHVHVCGHVDILIYPSIDGSHDPKHTQCVARTIEHLAEAHDGGILHCDLHLGNFMFANDPGASRIIDWDHARPRANPGKYVSNWNSTLPERHRDARPGCAISIDHDRYSLGQVLRRMAPCDESARNEWEDISWMACGDAPLQDVAARTRKLDCKMRLLDVKDLSVIVTGSPPRVGEIRSDNADVLDAAARVTRMSLRSMAAPPEEMAQVTPC